MKYFSINYHFIVLVGLHFTLLQTQIFLKKRRTSFVNVDANMKENYLFGTYFILKNF